MKNMKIGNVLLNLEFYSGQDFYSDGAVENEILEIVRSKAEISELLANDRRWSLLCHLSPQRRNLLEWYPFKAHASILEVGAGCGALTGLLCEKADKVTAVELSKKRAEIIANRYSEKENLEIIVGNLHDIKIKEKFDYITLIGVLEYAAKFTQSANPYVDFLAHMKQFLKADGVLVVAIENQFGLKYWAGASEDHTGKPFESIEGYAHKQQVATFGQEELTGLLQAAGYGEAEYYYPVPDYKLPTQIFSSHCLPAFGQIPGRAPNYDQDRLEVFDEKLAYNNIIKNNKFEFFANSFLVFCKNRG